MNGIFWAILAEVLIGVSLVVDKLLLGDVPKRAMPYVFWIGVLNIFGLLIIPFGFVFPGLTAILWSFAAGAAFLATLGCVYGALTRGGATNTLPIIGGFSPMAAYFMSTLVMFAPLNIADKVGFALLVLGGFILFFSEKFNFWRIIPWVLGAAFFTGLMDVLQKLAFTEGNFVSIFAAIKAATLLIALLLLLVPKFRKDIFSETKSAPKKHRVVYFVNRLTSGVGSFLIFYAISLTPQPALIESLSGLRYVIIFLAVFALSKLWPGLIKEKLRGWTLVLKIFATILIFAGLTGLSAQKYYETSAIPPNDKITWGVTFSEQMSKHFGLNWKENLDAIITDLKPKAIRLIAYWDDIEAVKGKFDYSDLDWQMNETRKAGVPTILVVGQRVPRWPECHFPAWADVNNEPDAVHAELMNFVTKTVERYKDYSNLAYWQVENEPCLIFGECPKTDANLLMNEVAKVKEIDPKAKIFLTDGGEFGDWYRASKLADAFGPTLYRKVNTRLFGYITWPLTPQIYPLRRDMTRALTGKKNQEFVISELGLEPWMVKQIYEVSSTTQFGFFNETDFKNVVSFGRQTGYTTFYTWGAEWWYWLKTTQNYPSFWNMAKELFAGKNI